MATLGSLPRMLAVLLSSFAYRIMAMLHILSAVVAFGPVFVYPSLRAAGDTSTLARLHMRVTFPALVLLWVLGMGLAGMSQDAYDLKQAWLAISVVLWLGLTAVSWFLIRPAITDGSAPAHARFLAGTGAMHLGLVVGLVLMIWKPGL